MIIQIQNKQRKYPVGQISVLVENAIKKTLSREKINDFIAKNRIVPVFSVILTGNKGIRQLNRQYREIDRETDVLSFPLLENNAKIITKVSKNALFPNENGEYELSFGDIVLSLEKAEEQALCYGHSMDREITFLTVHSVLHLLGYDHMNPAEEKKMIRRQKIIMKDITAEITDSTEFDKNEMENI